jgi:hypothetical protein
MPPLLDVGIIGFKITRDVLLFTLVVKKRAFVKIDMNVFDEPRGLYM